MSPTFRPMDGPPKTFAEILAEGKSSMGTIDITDPLEREQFTKELEEVWGEPLPQDLIDFFDLGEETSP